MYKFKYHLHPNPKKTACAKSAVQECMAGESTLLAQWGSSQCSGIASVEVMKSDSSANVEGTPPEAVVGIGVSYLLQRSLLIVES